VQTLCAQNPASLSNLRKKFVPVSGNVIKLDTLSIVPNSVSIANVLSTDYKVDEVNGTITWISKPALTVCMDHLSCIPL